MKLSGDWSRMDGSGLGKKEAMSSSDIPSRRVESQYRTPKKDMTVRTIESIEKQSGLVSCDQGEGKWLIT